VNLITDYPQFYDAIFDGSGLCFHRMAFSRGGLSKRQQFDLFESLGFRTPPHGTVAALCEGWRDVSKGIRLPEVAAHIEYVVYLDEFAHRGEGKVLLGVEQALERHAGQFASVYIQPHGPPTAYRLVRFGQLTFWLRQVSAGGDWRSNTRDQETLLSKANAEDPNPIRRVLWAIDFVPSAFGLLAVDFNTAPELSTLGETGALSAGEVMRQLEIASASDPVSLAQM
jgi:hypothetical protein